MFRPRISHVIPLLAGAFMAMPVQAVRTAPKGFLELDEIRYTGFAANGTYTDAAGAMYAYGDSGSTSVANDISLVKNASYEYIWKNDANLPLDTTNDIDTSTAGDPVYAGVYCRKMTYDLTATSLADATPRPLNYAGMGSDFSAPRNFTTAANLIFAYKLPNPQHQLSVSVGFRDSLHYVYTYLSATQGTPCPCAAGDTLIDSAHTGYVFLTAQLGSPGDSTWHVFNRAISALPGADTISKYMKWAVKTDFAVYWVDTVGQNPVLNGVTNRSITATGRNFTANGIAVIQEYALQGKLLAAIPVQVHAGQSYLEVCRNAQHAFGGVCLVKIKGPGVNAGYTVIR